jgi:RNA polymerase sigma factor (sigma-70 family)
MTGSNSEIAPDTSRPSVTAGFNRFLCDLRRRKAAAIQRLVNRYESIAINTVRRHLGTRLRERVDSQDLQQDFWVSVIRRIDRLPTIANSQAFRGYLRKVAFRQVTKQHRRHLIAERRRLSREVPLSAAGDHRGGGPPARSIDPSDVPENEEDLLRRLQPHLAEREFAILTKKLDGLSNREIARQIGVDEGSVRRSLRRIAKAVSQGTPVES